MTDKPTYRPNDIDLTSVSLVNYRGNVIDVRNMILEFNVYEDLYDVGMKCEVVMSDSLGLIERLPIVGDETIIISFKTPTFNKTRSYAFSVYSIKDRIKHKDRQYSYVIHGFSQETLNDFRTTTEGSHNGKISDIVERIYEKKLRPKQPQFTFLSPAINKIETEETKGTTSLIALKDTSPFEFIRYLQKQAQSDSYKPSDYMFWQNIDGWHFRTLSSLLDKDPIDSYYFTETSIEDDRDNTKLMNDSLDEPIRQYQKISFVNYSSQFNIIDAYDEGLFYNETEILDPLKKEFSQRVFRYDTDFGRLTHTSSSKYITQNSPHANIPNGRCSNYIIGEIGENYSGQGYLKNAKGNDVRVSNPLKLQELIDLRQASMAQLSNIVLDIGIPGNSDIKVGDKIKIFLQQGSTEKEYKDKNNLLFGQKNPTFLITACRHTFNRENNQYSTILQCVKDTYGITPVEADA